MHPRQAIQSILDKCQFYFDLFPGLSYQPLPWLGLNKARRGVGTIQRWTATEEALTKYSCRSAIDIGCNLGFFSFAIAKMGIPVLAIDNYERYLRIPRYASERMDITNVGFLNLEVNPNTIRLLPESDSVIFLSVFHHWVRFFGFSAATEMLGELWDKCNVVMFFEAGEAEMPPCFGLPEMKPTCQEWLDSYLCMTCEASTVKHLGRFKAFAPGGNETKHLVERNLFEVHRTSMPDFSDESPATQNPDLEKL
jgi:hypothetical protein